MTKKLEGIQTQSDSTQKLVDSISQMNSTINDLEEKLEVSRSRCRELDRANENLKNEMTEEFKNMLSKMYSDKEKELEFTTEEEEKSSLDLKVSNTLVPELLIHGVPNTKFFGL